VNREFQVLAWMLNRLLGCLARVFIPAKPFYRKEIFKSLSKVGADSIPIVSVIAACTGIILALQAAQQLEKVGAISYVANLVGVTILMELGPLLTAIIITGRSGAAFAAEIAAMQISEEIDALEVMGLEPVQYLVWPKFVAMLVMVPCLTVLADFVGICAGGIFSSAFLGINGHLYFEQSVTFLKTNFLYTGLVKSLGFGVTIAVIGCWQGFLARKGAADVGRMTTRAVVQSIFLIILLDLFFTTLNYLFR
jgi:phospholipid/cholesterol/gamma-HCH transport system permease protein